MSSDGIMDFDPIYNLSVFPWGDDKENSNDNYQKSENKIKNFNPLKEEEESPF